MMKKTILTAVALTMLVSLSACGDDTKKLTVNDTEVTLGKTTVKQLSDGGLICTPGVPDLSIDKQTATINSPVTVTKEDEKPLFSVSLMNLSDRAIPYTDCAIRGVLVDAGNGTLMHNGTDMMVKFATLDECVAINTKNLSYKEEKVGELVEANWRAEQLEWYAEYGADGNLLYLTARVMLD